MSQVTFTLPKDIPNGQYFIRAEDIALHVRLLRLRRRHGISDIHDSFNATRSLRPTEVLNSTSPVHRSTSREVEAARRVPLLLSRACTPDTSQAFLSVSFFVARHVNSRRSLTKGDADIYYPIVSIFDLTNAKRQQLTERDIKACKLHAARSGKS